MHSPSSPAADKILGALDGAIAPVRLKLSYRVAIALVAFCMVLLPLIYVALVGVAAYALVWHATTSIHLFTSMGSKRVAAVFYITPLFAGGVLLLFMVKPLFAKRPPPPKTVSLKPEDEPLLFEFVAKLCGLIGAPMPTRIDVDCAVNASASFRRGAWSMFSNDLVLTIGLPLVAGLNLRQLTGVLSHEFGHFAQGSGMRLSFVVRSISGWFARVVYERDEWDERLIHHSENSDWRLQIILYVARLFVWITRRILWVLMYTGHLISCFLLRQMEFDADRYEARVAGSDVFRQTAEKLPQLSIAYGGAISDLSASWRDRRLADDLPGVVMHNLGRLPDEVTHQLSKQLVEGETSVFDTHPCDRERIASAAAEASDGVFRLELPARALFSDFAETSRTCSRSFYGEQLEEPVPEQSLVPVDQFLVAQRQKDAEQDAIQAFFGDNFTLERPLGLTPEAIAPSRDVDGDRKELQAAAARMAALAPEVKSPLEAFHGVLETQRELLGAEAMLRAGIRVDADSFGLDGSTTDHAADAFNRTQVERARIEQTLEDYDSAVRKRLTLGLSIALTESTGLATLQPILDTHQRLEQVVPRTDELERDFLQQQAVLNNLEHVEEEQGLQLQGEVISRSADMRRALIELRERLEDVPYLFDHAHEDVSLGHALVKDVPRDADDVGPVMGAVAGSLEHFHQARARVLARLLVAVQEAEAAYSQPSSSPSSVWSSSAD